MWLFNVKARHLNQKKLLEKMNKAIHNSEYCLKSSIFLCSFCKWPLKAKIDDIVNFESYGIKILKFVELSVRVTYLAGIAWASRKYKKIKQDQAITSRI